MDIIITGVEIVEEVEAVRIGNIKADDFVFIGGIIVVTVTIEFYAYAFCAELVTGPSGIIKNAIIDIAACAVIEPNVVPDAEGHIGAAEEAEVDGQVTTFVFFGVMSPACIFKAVIVVIGEINFAGLFVIQLEFDSGTKNTV